ncbi:hypothetical protein [Paenibacillus polymyxa]|uniref:hypothetical protein n=1 Tax=Paenibacillus polymyxa TaxID=1406 RepID=UPI0039BD7A58
MGYEVNTGNILVLFILLVIILNSFPKFSVKPYAKTKNASDVLEKSNGFGATTLSCGATQCAYYSGGYQTCHNIGDIKITPSGNIKCTSSGWEHVD